MNTIENNKLIAEFMGLRRGWWISQQKPLTDNKKQWCDMDNKTILGTKVYYDKDLKFHTSFDWLMLVIEKILNLKNTYAQERQKVFTSITPDIKITYQSVIHFINWYNQQQK